jgi:hypothetical protein
MRKKERICYTLMRIFFLTNKLQHKKNHYTGNGHIQPDGKRPFGNFAVFLEFSGEGKIKT